MRLFRTVVDGIREEFGYPVSLLRALQELPVRAELMPPVQCIDADSVARWHELGGYPVWQWPRRDRGELQGWRAGSGYYESFRLERPEYAQIGQREIVEDWTCDISQLHGFSGSKSDLRRFTTTDAMVQTNSRGMIDEISLAKLAKNLAHDEIRILHRDETSDHFTRYLWDGRLWLMNGGGSHHLAAAKYIAVRLGVAVPLRAKLYVYSLNASPIESLRRDFEMFVISDEPAVFNAFLDAMRAYRATWLSHHMPRPYDNTRAILLPKSERRSTRVAEELRRAGMVDLGCFLADLAASQSSSAEANALHDGIIAAP